MSFIAKPIAKRVFKNKLQEYNDRNPNRDPEHDLIHEWVKVLDANGRPTGKKRKQDRRVPEGISEHDAKILLAVRRRAHRLDESMKFCGIKFGVSSVIGLIPAAGDFVDVGMALFVFASCTRIEGGVGKYGVLMLLLILADLIAGLVPVLGDVADTFLRCNKNNAELLNYILKKRGQENLRKLGIAPTATEKTTRGTGQITAQPAPATMVHPSNLQTAHLGPSSRYETNHGDHDYSSHTEPIRPEPAQLNSTKTGGRGWFGRLMDPQRQTDVEEGGSSVELTGERRFINGDDLRRAKEATAK